jgi:hypothetical protein
MDRQFPFEYFIREFRIIGEDRPICRYSTEHLHRVGVCAGVQMRIAFGERDARMAKQVAHHIQVDAPHNQIARIVVSAIVELEVGNFCPLA